MHNWVEGASDSDLNRSCIDEAGEDADHLITEEANLLQQHHPTNWMELDQTSQNFLDDGEIPTADIFSFMSGMQDHLQPPSELHTENISAEISTLYRQDKPQRPSNQTHSAAEKRRRDKFKEKIKAMEELLPNCKKGDTTSILDEAIKKIQLLKYHLELVNILRQSHHFHEQWFRASYLSLGDSRISPIHAAMVPPTFIPTRLVSANLIGRVGFGAGANAGISPVHASTMVSPALIIPTRPVNANATDIGAGADVRTTLYPTMLPSLCATAPIQMSVPQAQTQLSHMASTSAVDTTSTSFATGGSSSCVQTSNASN